MMGRQLKEELGADYIAEMGPDVNSTVIRMDGVTAATARKYESKLICHQYQANSPLVTPGVDSPPDVLLGASTNGLNAFHTI